MTNDNQPDQEFFKEVLQAQVVEVRCNGCGADTIMNAAYAQYVKNGLRACGNCRRP